MKPLDQIQREFFQALRMPLRGTSRASTELPPSAEGHSAEFLEKAEELMAPGINLSSAERLELYHRQFWFRLLDSIAEDFPILRKMAGEADFWSLMESYLETCPSESYTLRHLGRNLPEFARGWRGVEERRRQWFGAIARLEYAYMEIFEAAEWERVKPEALGSASLGLQPHVILLELAVPADLCEERDTLPGEDGGPVHLTVWRGERRGRLQCRLDPLEHELLLRLRHGGTLEFLFAEPASREPSPEEIAAWFGNWQARGWIAEVPGAEVIDFPPRSAVREGDLDFAGVDKMGSQARAMED